jgi:hypothetical protein
MVEHEKHTAAGNEEVLGGFASLRFDFGSAITTEEARLLSSRTISMNSIINIACKNQQDF